MDETSKQYIEQEVQKHQLIIVANGFDTTQITTAIIALAEAFEVVFETISENLRPLAQWLDEYGLSLDQYNLSLDQIEFAVKKRKGTSWILRGLLFGTRYLVKSQSI